MDIKPYAYLNNIQVDRVVSDVSSYLKKAEAYLSTLILVKAIKMVADGMDITFSNREWLNKIKDNTTVRGLQHAFNKLESTILPGFNEPIFQRTFKDDKKRYRTAFKVDTKQLIHLLRLKESDVKDLPRGSIEKHFFYQSGLVVRDYIKQIKRAEKLLENKKFKSDTKLQEKYNQIINEIRVREQEFTKHVKRIFTRVEKAINKSIVITEELKHEARKELVRLLKDNDYDIPPNEYKN